MKIIIDIENGGYDEVTARMNYRRESLETSGSTVPEAITALLEEMETIDERYGTVEFEAE